MNLAPTIKLIEEFEGFRAKAYVDPVNIWTIGFGTTIYPDDSRVKRGDLCTEVQALSWLSNDIMKLRIPAIKNYVKVSLNQNEIQALVSFVYNIGNTAFERSTLLRKLNARRPRKEVADEFYRWTKARGTTLIGLVRRRSIEHDLFLLPDSTEQVLA